MNDSLVSVPSARPPRKARYTRISPYEFKGYRKRQKHAQALAEERAQAQLAQQKKAQFVDLKQVQVNWLLRMTPMLLFFVACGLVFPLVSNFFWLKVFTSVFCVALASASVGLLFGQLGIVSLCQMALFGLGGWYTLRLSFAFELPFELSLLLGGLIAGVLGTLSGLPALRMRGLYLALVSLMFAGAFQIIIGITGFPDGGEGWLGKVVSGQRHLMPRPAIATSDAGYFIYTLVVVALGFILIEYHRRSRAGRAWGLIRKGEAAALASGVNVVFYKAWAFTVAGFLAGIAGGLLAASNGQLDSQSFPAGESILLFALTVVGGSYHWMGALVAALLLRGLPALLTDHEVNGNFATIFFGFALLMSLLADRKGLVGKLKEVFKLIRTATLLQALLLWALNCLICGGLWLYYASYSEQTHSYWGGFFIALTAIILLFATPGVIGGVVFRFFKVDKLAEKIGDWASAGIFFFSDRLGLRRNYAWFSNLCIWAFNMALLAWIGAGAFDTNPWAVAALVLSATFVRTGLNKLAYTPLMPLRDLINARWPKATAKF